MARSITITLVLVLLLPAMIVAQGVTTGAFAGKVVDVDGNPVLGAEITILHVPTNTRTVVLTRPNGRFSAPSVRAGGPYTVTASFESFQTETKANLTVKLGETKHVDFTLQLATVDAGEIVVTATNPIINPERSGAGQNVDADAIASIPTIERNFSDFARMSPQVMVADQYSDRSFSVGGRNNRYNNVQIDGAVNNDLFGLNSLGTPGGYTNSTPISLDAVQEFQLMVAPYDVRHGGFTGGGLNAITKSGANNFSGSAYFYGRNQSFIGTGFYDEKYDEFDESTFGIRLGGPLKEDKVFFFVSGEIVKRNSPVSYVLDGAQRAAGERFLSILNNNYGYNPGSLDIFTANQDSNKIFARLDWNINANHRLSLRHNFIDANRESLSRNGFNFELDDNMVNYENVTHSTVLQLSSTLNSNMFNELIVNYTTIRDDRAGPSRFPGVEVQTDSGTTFLAGTERYSTANDLDQDLIEITDNLTIVSGNHQFVIGTHNEFFKFRNLFIADNFGFYEFDSLDDFEAGTASYYSYIYSIVPGNASFAPSFNVAQLAFYAGDTWTVNPNLTLTFGVRADVTFIPDKPSRNPDVEALFDGKRTDETPSGKWNISPRFGFNYDVSGNRSTQIRGGVGLFSGRTPYVWISNQYANTGIEFARLSAGYWSPFVPTFNPDPDSQETNLSSGTNEINLIDKNYKYPQVLRTSLAFDHEFPNGFTATIEGVYTKNINEVHFQNINLIQTGTHPLDGRPTYFGGRTTFDYYNVTYMTNTNKGYSYSLSGQVQKRFRTGSWLNAMYTYGVSKDINSNTSSQALSSWKYSTYGGYDVNNPPLAYSNQDVRHRVGFGGALVLDLFKKAPTTFSVFYNARSGRPFNYKYSNDVNGDGQRYNDSIYVPASEDEIILVGGTWDELQAYINSNPGLAAARGSVVDRNAGRHPWRHNLDMRLTQQIPVPGLAGDGKLEVTLDVLNFLNLLNREWGLFKSVYYRGVDVFNFRGYDSATGKPILDFLQEGRDPWSISNLLSRWQMQLGIRYTFGGR